MSNSRHAGENGATSSGLARYGILRYRILNQLELRGSRQACHANARFLFSFSWQLRIFPFRLPEDRYIAVAIFPQRQESIVGIACTPGIPLQGQCPG